MRPFRVLRLLTIPAVIVPLVLSGLIASGPAWARGINAKKPVACRTVTGTVSSWELQSCSNPAITGGFSTSITPAFPTTAQIGFDITITWNPDDAAKAGGPSGTTTVKVSVSKLTKNKCAAGKTEWEVSGAVLSNTVKPAVKGKIKIFVCESTSGALTNRLKKGNLRPAKL